MSNSPLSHNEGYIKLVILITKRRDFVTGATTEVASLKKALSEDEDKAALECTESETQDARVGEVQQELQELGKKFESVEHELKAKEAELAKALASIKDAKAEAEKARQEVQEAKKIAAGKKFFMQSKHVEEAFFYLHESGALQGHSQICHAVYRTPRSSTVLRRGAQRRSCSDPSMLGPNIQRL